MAQPGTWHALYEWRLERVVDAGMVKLPDGWLSGGDPSWSREGVSFELRLAPGAYPVRVAVAVAERESQRWRECAAAELIIDGDVAPTRWELVPTLAFATPGWRLLDRGGRGVLRSDRLARDRSNGGARSASARAPRLGQLDDDDGDDELSLVLFTVGPQHGECLTFAGHDDTCRVTRVVTDLGLLDLDPRTQPLPW